MGRGGSVFGVFGVIRGFIPKTERTTQAQTEGKNTNHPARAFGRHHTEMNDRGYAISEDNTEGRNGNPRLSA